LINLVGEPPNALEDRFVLPEEIRPAAPKLYELDRELFDVRLSLSGHVPVIGTSLKSMKRFGYSTMWDFLASAPACARELAFSLRSTALT
jgi:hypothetical protein